MSAGITRRKALATVPAVAATVAMPAVAAFPSLGDDPVVALEAELHQTDTAWNAAIEAIENAELAQSKLWRGPDMKYPSPHVVIGNQGCSSEEEVRRCAVPTYGGYRASDAEIAKALKVFRRREKKYLAARERHGLAELETAREQAEARYYDVLEAFATTVPTTLAGIAAKVRELKEAAEDGQGHYDGEIAETALEGIERLAGAS